MAVHIEFDPSMARLAGGLEPMEAEPAAVQQVLTQVARRYPPLQTRLFNCEGEMRNVVKVRLNGQPTQPAALVKDGDTLLLTLE